MMMVPMRMMIVIITPVVISRSVPAIPSPPRTIPIRIIAVVNINSCSSTIPRVVPTIVPRVVVVIFSNDGCAWVEVESTEAARVVIGVVSVIVITFFYRGVLGCCRIIPLILIRLPCFIVVISIIFIAGYRLAFLLWSVITYIPIFFFFFLFNIFISG